VHPTSLTSPSLTTGRFSRRSAAPPFRRSGLMPPPGTPPCFGGSVPGALPPVARSSDPSAGGWNELSPARREYLWMLRQRCCYPAAWRGPRDGATADVPAPAEGAMVFSGQLPRVDTSSVPALPEGTCSRMSTPCSPSTSWGLGIRVAATHGEHCNLARGLPLGVARHPVHVYPTEIARLRTTEPTDRLAARCVAWVLLHGRQPPPSR